MCVHWALPANSMVSSQLFSYSDIILSPVVAAQTLNMSAFTQVQGKRIYENMQWIHFSWFCIVWECLGSKWELSTWSMTKLCRLPLVPTAFLFREQAKTQGTSLIDMRVCATSSRAAQQGCGDSERGISSGQGNVFTDFPEQATRKLFFKENKERCHLFGNLKVFRHFPPAF